MGIETFFAAGAGVGVGAGQTFFESGAALHAVLDNRVEAGDAGGAGLTVDRALHAARAHLTALHAHSVRQIETFRAGSTFVPVGGAE